MDTPPYTGLAMMFRPWYNSFTTSFLSFLQLNFRFSRTMSGIPIIIATTISITGTVIATITFLLVVTL